MPEKFDLEVSARTGHGQDFFPVYHPAKEKRPNMKGIEVPGLSPNATIEDAKKLCIDYIKKHRAGGQSMEYRIRDNVSGNILG